MADIRHLVNSATKHRRLDMLHQLVDGLTFEDRRLLARIISAKNDPFANLPVELTIQILGYLPILDAWKLQLVCRAWQSLFSENRILRTALARWETHRPCDSARDRHWTVQEEAIKSKVRHMQAMRLGRPFSSAAFMRNLASHETNQNLQVPNSRSQTRRTVALQGARIAYLDSDPDGGDRVIVRNLLTAVIFDGRLMVRDLVDLGPPAKVVRLPSSSICGFHADEHLVGVLYNISNRPVATAYIWNNVTKTGHTSREFPLSGDVEQEANQAAFQPRSVRIDAAHPGSIDIFAQSTRQRDEFQLVVVAYLRFSLADGRELGRSYSPLLQYAPDELRPNSFDLGDVSSTGSGQSYNLITTPLHPEDQPDEDERLLLCFDAEKAPKMDILRFACDRRFSRYHYITPWKDILYVDPNAGGIRAISQDGLVSTPHGSESLRLRSENGLTDFQPTDSSSMENGMLINDTFLLTFTSRSRTRPTKGYIQVYCFDENLDWKFDEKFSTPKWDTISLAWDRKVPAQRHVFPFDEDPPKDVMPASIALPLRSWLTKWALYEAVDAR